MVLVAVEERHHNISEDRILSSWRYSLQWLTWRVEYCEGALGPTHPEVGLVEGGGGVQGDGPLQGPVQGQVVRTL